MAVASAPRTSIIISSLLPLTMNFPKVATRALISTLLLLNPRAVLAADDKYGVYFSTTNGALYPNDTTNPMGDPFIPQSPKDWANVDRVSMIVKHLKR